MLLVTFILFTFSCVSNHSKNEILTASGRYDHFIKAMKADSIASMFTRNGSLGDIASGRDSIYRFLLKFKNIKVLLQESTTDSISIHSDSAVQIGTYKQVDVLPNNDTVQVKGRFITKWNWLRNEGWLIQKIETSPEK